MNTLFRITLVLAASLLALGGTAAAQEQPASGAPEKELTGYLRQLGRAAMDDNAAPRGDEAQATIVGTVREVTATEILTDGTPYRFVVVRSSKPFTHDVVVVCAGTSLNAACGRLTTGKRASFAADVFLFGGLVPESVCGEDCDDVVLLVTGPAPRSIDPAVERRDQP